MHTCFSPDLNFISENLASSSSSACLPYLLIEHTHSSALESISSWEFM